MVSSGPWCACQCARSTCCLSFVVSVRAFFFFLLSGWGCSFRARFVFGLLNSSACASLFQRFFSSLFLGSFFEVVVGFVVTVVVVELFEELGAVANIFTVILDAGGALRC